MNTQQSNRGEPRRHKSIDTNSTMIVGTICKIDQNEKGLIIEIIDKNKIPGGIRARVGGAVLEEYDKGKVIKNGAKVLVMGRAHMIENMEGRKEIELEARYVERRSVERAANSLLIMGVINNIEREGITVCHRGEEGREYININTEQTRVIDGKRIKIGDKISIVGSIDNSLERAPIRAEQIHLIHRNSHEQEQGR